MNLQGKYLCAVAVLGLFKAVHNPNALMPRYLTQRAA